MKVKFEYLSVPNERELEVHKITTIALTDQLYTASATTLNCKCIPNATFYHIVHYDYSIWCYRSC